MQGSVGCDKSRAVSSFAMRMNNEMDKFADMRAEEISA